MGATWRDSGAQRSQADRHAVGSNPGDSVMSTTLPQLMEELLQSIEQRDAGDPDAPAWEASARIERLEAELALRLSATDARRPPILVTGAAPTQPDEAVTVLA